MANEENASKSLEDFKNGIIEIIKEFNANNTKKLLKTIKEALKDENPESTVTKKQLPNKEYVTESIEIYKNRIIKIIKEAKDYNTKNLLKAVKKALIDEKHDKIKHKILFWFINSFLIILAIAFSVLTPFIEIENEMEIEMQFGFLAFVVALASYVASVARQIIEKLPAKNKDKHIKLRKNLLFLVAAEIQLVTVGLFAILRIILGPCPFELFPCKCLSLDTFLILYLAVILLYMVFLHVRVWIIEKPWNIEKHYIND